jgi:two-component system, OmpR family, copper resistance phosphate regulon response regulator CusR
MPKKILIVEDELKTLHALQKGFEEQGIAVDIAYDGATGYKLASTEIYDAIISDIIMPQMTGLQMLKSLRDAGIKTPILLLTALNQTDDKVQGLDVGADDYLGKPFEFKELMARLRALVRRNHVNVTDPVTLSFADLEMNLDAKVCVRAGRKIELTPREFAFMEYLIRNKGRVISKSEIAEKVWDIHFDTGTNVIEVYVNYLRNKVDKPFAQKLIHTAFGMGYILKQED